MGFTDYFEVAIAAEVVTSATYDYLKKATHFPIISSAENRFVKNAEKPSPFAPNIGGKSPAWYG